MSEPATAPDRLRVLLVAPTVDGTDVGEAWVAYQWAHHLSLLHDVTLLTYRKRDRPSCVDQLPRARVVEWVEPPLVGRAERLNSLMKPGYLPFHHRARRWARRAIGDGELFDVIHQPLPVAMRYPSPAVGLGVPLVIGPVGGGLDSPPGFLEDDTSPWYVKLRVLDATRRRRDPWLRRTYTGADCVLGIAPYVADLLVDLPIRRFVVMSETGLEQLPDEHARSRPTTHTRLLFVGRLIRTKGAREAIRALALLSHLPVKLDIVGDGFDRSACEQLAVDLGVTHRVTFWGQRTRSEVDTFYKNADIFVFPSFQEPGGNVAFEAMGAGLPAVVANRGGPGNVVDDTCGVAVDVTTPDAYVRELAAAIEKLATNPALRQSLGHGARKRVGEVGLWSAKASSISEIYRDLVQGRPDTFT